MPRLSKKSLGVVYKVGTAILFLGAFAAGWKIPDDDRVKVDSDLKAQHSALTREYREASSELQAAHDAMDLAFKEKAPAMKRYGRIINRFGGPVRSDFIECRDFNAVQVELMLHQTETLGQSTLRDLAAVRLLRFQAEMLRELTDLPAVW